MTLAFGVFEYNTWMKLGMHFRIELTRWRAARSRRAVSDTPMLMNWSRGRRVWTRLKENKNYPGESWSNEVDFPYGGPGPPDESETTFLISEKVDPVEWSRRSSENVSSPYHRPC